MKTSLETKCMQDEFQLLDMLHIEAIELKYKVPYNLILTWYTSALCTTLLT